MKTISASKATPPGGHYAQAVEHNGLIFVSGQLGFEPGTTIKSATTVEEEVRNCLGNLSTILTSAGSALSKVIKTTIYISSVEDWPTVNAAYTEVMGQHRPARAIVPCGDLHHGFKVEIEAIAFVE